MDTNRKKRKRTELSVKQKHEICIYKEKLPKASQEEIARHFNIQWNTDLSRRTVSDILMQKEKWSIVQGHASVTRSSPKRVRSAKNKELEKALFLWFTQMRSRNAVITDAIVIEKARLFGSQMAVENFSYSSGWLTRFKGRYNISMKALCGESENVDAAVDRFEVSQEIKDYSTNDVCNGGCARLLKKEGLHRDNNNSDNNSSAESKLPSVGDLISTTDYVNTNKNELTNQELTDKEIIQMVLEVEDKSGSSDEEPGIPTPSLHDAQQAMEVLLKYFESDKNTTVNEMNTILEVQKILSEKSVNNLHQAK